MTALIVDDSLTVRMDLAEALAENGLPTTLCKSLAEAREALRTRTFFLVLLDVRLPDGDGIDLLKEIRAGEQSAMPVLLLSSESEVQDRLRGLTTGADEYIGKPYDRGYVVARALELCRRDQPRSVPQTILVIDDSPTFRDALRSSLSTAGYAVTVAASGEEGLRVAAEARPLAIVVDGVLPGIDGPGVIRRIRLDAALRRTPCLLLTASDDRHAEVHALDAGADAFVRKQEDTSVVLARLAALLRSTTQHDERMASSLGPNKILAVDDSPTYLNELASALRGDGYAVVLARSGEEALEILAVEPVDCILLDVIMPGLGGEETCRRIKDAPIVRDTPLIMLTSLEDRDAMIRGLAAGADDYIAKSSDLQVLRARVLAQIRRKRFEDENRGIREQLLRKELEASEARSAKELAETKVALLEDVERKNKELETFAYSVSHDLRAPLRSIDGFSQLLVEEHASELDEEGKDYLRRVRVATKRMGDLIDDLLELSRVGRAALERESVDLAEMGREVAVELSRREPARNVELQTPNRLLADADPRMMRIVLENLLGNAWKFTNGAPVQKVVLTVNERVYRVSDTGAGFDMAHADKLFAPFQRLHDEREFPGTGIGLATVHRIIDRHGGRIWAESTPGNGATIFFTLGRAP
jgi:DNA-binding response OmpR family regulator